MISRYQRWLIVATVLALPSAVSAEGINLSWDDCGTFGARNKTFDCLSNSGTKFTMVASFIPPPNVNRFLGISSQIDVYNYQGPLPNWWKFGSSECRGASALSTNFDFTGGPYNCTDFYGGRAQGSFAYDIGFGSPNRARLRVQAAVPTSDAAPVYSDFEYCAYKVAIDRTRTVGMGSWPRSSAFRAASFYR